MVKAVTYILENNAAVQGLVGNRADGDTGKHKVFPVVVFEKETAPYIVVTQISKAQVGRDCGYSYGINVLSYHNSYDDVIELNDAVITAVKAQTPGMVNGVEYGFLNLVNEADGYDKEHNLYIKVSTFEGNGS